MSRDLGHWWVSRCHVCEKVLRYEYMEDGYCVWQYDRYHECPYCLTKLSLRRFQIVSLEGAIDIVEEEL
jgi:uncharacterized protein CbrC (UPF0167 family)